MLGVDYMDTQTELAMELVQETGVTYPLVADPEGLVNSAAGEVRFLGLPHFAFVDGSGRVIHQMSGGVESAQELVALANEHFGMSLG